MKLTAVFGVALVWCLYQSSETNTRPPEPPPVAHGHLPGHFKIGTMNNSLPWLNCHQIHTEVRTLKTVGKGWMKEAFLSEWRGQKVVLSRAYRPESKKSVLHGISMLQALQAPQVIQLVGSCPDDFTVVTEYHPLGSLDKLDTVLAEPRHHDSWELRLRLAMDYVSVIVYLHANHRVMCDSKNLQNTLAQFLVKSDFHLVVNDLDQLPEVDTSKGLLVKCGTEELFGDFVPPEQRWPFHDEGLAFNDELMPRYDEKTDIWKFPEVAHHLLQNVPGCDVALSRLSQIHKKCKRIDPAMRPSAQEVLRIYRLVYANMTSPPRRLQSSLFSVHLASSLCFLHQHLSTMGNAAITINHPACLDHYSVILDGGKVVDETPTLIHEPSTASPVISVLRTSGQFFCAVCTNTSTMGNATITINHPACLDHYSIILDGGKVVDETPTSIRMEATATGCGGHVKFRKTQDTNLVHSEMYFYVNYLGHDMGTVKWVSNLLNLGFTYRWALDSEMVIDISLQTDVNNRPKKLKPKKVPLLCCC